MVLQRWCCRDGVGTKATRRCNIVHLSDFCLCGSGLARDGFRAPYLFGKYGASLKTIVSKPAPTLEQRRSQAGLVSDRRWPISYFLSLSSGLANRALNETSDDSFSNNGTGSNFPLFLPCSIAATILSGDISVVP